MEPEARRRILEAVASDEQTSTSDRLRALELLAKLDGEPEADPEFEDWKRFSAMSDEQLAREAEALELPLTTPPSYGDVDDLLPEGTTETVQTSAALMVVAACMHVQSMGTARQSTRLLERNALQRERSRMQPALSALTRAAAGLPPAGAQTGAQDE